MSALVRPASAPPPGYHVVTDDTGLITVAIPDGWNVVSAPWVAGDTVSPRLLAGPGAVVAQPWGDEIDGTPVLEVYADALSDTPVPQYPVCVGMQVLAFDDPFLLYGEFDQARGVDESAHIEPGPDTSECDSVFEYAIAEDATGGVTYSVNFRAFMVSDPSPVGLREQEWEVFDVALASLAPSGLTFTDATMGYLNANAPAQAPDPGDPSAEAPTPGDEPAQTPSHMEVPEHTFVVPAGYHLVTDDTGLITVAIPDGWNVLTVPAIDTEGTIYPRVMAGLSPAVETEWGPIFESSPTIEVSVTPLDSVPLPDSPPCFGMQVVPSSDSFIFYTEVDTARGVGPYAIVEPGDNTSECDVVFEHGVMADAISETRLDLYHVSWGAGDPPSANSAEQDWEIFDVALASLTRPPLTYADAVANYKQANNVGTPPGGDQPGGDQPGGDQPGGDGPIGVEPAGGLLAWPIDGDPLSLWPYPSFRDVPQFGYEPVRGSGCGADGSIGEQIPDGLWAGFLFPGSNGTVKIDLACVYFGQTAKDVVAGGGKVVADYGPDFVVINNNPRQRTLRDEGIALLWGVPQLDGSCPVEVAWDMSPPGIAGELYYPDSLAWVRTFDGAVTWAAFDCGAAFSEGG